MYMARRNSIGMCTSACATLSATASACASSPARADALARSGVTGTRIEPAFSASPTAETWASSATAKRNVTVEDGPRWVDQGDVVTSAGISAGIDMSLHLVERLQSRTLAAATARQMDFHRAS